MGNLWKTANHFAKKTNGVGWWLGGKNGPLAREFRRKMHLWLGHFSQKYPAKPYLKSHWHVLQPPGCDCVSVYVTLSVVLLMPGGPVLSCYLAATHPWPPLSASSIPLITPPPGGGDDHTLTHWGRDKIDAILQTTFSNATSLMKMSEFRLKFHWSLFLNVQFTIFQHWFR